MPDLLYNGKELIWKGEGVFNATSGMRGFQKPEHQCVAERGPVPEGNYYIPLIIGQYAKDNGEGICQLEPSWRIQKIPRGEQAGKCEPYWANWGRSRVRFEPSDTETKMKCKPRRSGFYLHDSVKGFSHGCIEVEKRFFDILLKHVKTSNDKKLTLKIKYQEGIRTYGGTKK